MDISPLAKKLQIKPGHQGVLLNAPAGYRESLEPLPDGAAILDAAAASARHDFVQIFAADMADLERSLPAALAAVKPDALLWIAYPKGGAKAVTDLNRDILWAAVGDHGFTGVSLIALDDKWSAMRFRPADRVGKG